MWRKYFLLLPAFVLLVVSSCLLRNDDKAAPEQVAADFDIGAIHNEILAQFHARHNLTANDRLPMQTWIRLLLDSAADAYEANGLPFDREEGERGLIKMLQIANYIRESTGVDLRTIHMSQSPGRDFGRVLDQLASVGLLAPEVASAVQVRVEAREGGQPERLRSRGGNASDLAAMQQFDQVNQASGRFWGPLLDGEECGCCPNCGDSRVRSAVDALGGLLGGLVCGPACSAIGSAGYSILYTQLENECNTPGQSTLPGCDTYVPPDPPRP